MNHSPPVRVSLVSQSAAFLRQELQAGRWEGLLPSEGELGRELGVSRGTLRSALALLFEEGLLVPAGRGGQHRIARQPKARRTRKTDLPGVTGGLVRILSPQPRFIVSGLTQLIFQTMSEGLGRMGLHLEFEHHEGLWKLQRPDTRLRKITAKSDTAAWVLYRSTEAIQRWFADSGIPAVVLGGIYPGIPLSHAEFNLAAASHHAAGVFAARGHRRMVILTVERATAGDKASDRSFLAAAAAAGAHAEVVVFDDTVPDLCRKLDGVMLGQPPPTAFLVNFPNHAPATIGHLTRRGYPVPKAAAVISRMDSRMLAESIPSVARYQLDAEKLGRSLARLLRQTLTGSLSQSILMPEFIDGESAGGRETL